MTGREVVRYLIELERAIKEPPGCPACGQSAPHYCVHVQALVNAGTEVGRRTLELELQEFARLL